jgi:hypothetical protein
VEQFKLKYELECEHDKGILKMEDTKAVKIYRCPKCNCIYCIGIAKNDNACWAKRFPVKK